MWITGGMSGCWDLTHTYVCALGVKVDIFTTAICCIYVLLAKTTSLLFYSEMVVICECLAYGVPAWVQLGHKCCIAENCEGICTYLTVCFQTGQLSYWQNVNVMVLQLKFCHHQLTLAILFRVPANLCLLFRCVFTLWLLLHRAFQVLVCKFHSHCFVH